MSISQSSMDVRLQKLICCIGTLAGEIGDSLYIGGCYTEKLDKLKILIGYLEALECYSIDDEEVLATGTILLANIVGNVEINIFVNGISISGIFTTTAASVLVNTTALITQINNYQSTYVASITGGSGSPYSIILTGLCSNDTITATENSDTTTVTVTGLSGGICTGNCLTEEQVLRMFERVSEYCDICFPASGYQFTNSTIEVIED